MAETVWLSREFLTDWGQFSAQIRSKGCQLLKRLDDFPNSVLVAGCQRSGTTMLSRIITQSEGMTNYWFGPDDELDAALILSGYVGHAPEGRYCFQTTYVNSCFREYFEHRGSYKLIWVLRNPYSVVYSLLHNWTADALVRLFRECGVELLRGRDAILHEIFGDRGVSRIRQACYSYIAKTMQVFELKQHLEPGQLLILDYDDLVVRKMTLLPAVYKFIDVKFQNDYLRKVSSESVKKAQHLLSKEATVVREMCEDIYQQATSLKTIG